MAKEENLFEEKAKEEGGKPAANADKLKASPNEARRTGSN